MSKRDLNPDEVRVLRLFVRAGENGRNAWTWAERVIVGELESRDYLDWVDGRLYLVTEAGKKHFAELKPQTHTMPSR